MFSCVIFHEMPHGKSLSKEMDSDPEETAKYVGKSGAKGAGRKGAGKGAGGKDSGKAASGKKRRKVRSTTPPHTTAV